ncbi:HupE/UreJ family protein [Cyanobacterium stanieri LEGE 03274]|uniref:HupE/UreJ family protein n=1 Tax=Cyanobacterium stanieri LEGE 03274 TaxID=1828756 RepID=A0ABR9V343_9CHRO|nr:HupE/UreJ family protein [Cyanobacterium stanieri]MBE9221239.1 HupE/UreJ family protein [Cyanobacterium stanieri LEGE 03274]
MKTITNIKTQLILITSTIALVSLWQNPALAHHPLDGKTPSNFFEGFMSGLGHPIIGLDHFAFIIATGCFAALLSLGLIIPTGFIVASVIGTGIHLMGVNLPYAETIIALSVLLSGITLALGKKPQQLWLISFALMAGIFHGYAYGEAVIGATMTPLISYLVGFSLIQWIIAFVSYKLISLTKSNINESPNNSLNLRFVGFTLSGIGITVVSSLFI